MQLETRKRSLLPVAAAGVLALSAAPALAAQSPMMLEAYAARTDALAENPLFGGLAFTAYGGPFALRLNGGLHLERDDGLSRQSGIDPRCRRYECRRFSTGRLGYRGSSGAGVAAWTADADVVFEPLRAAPVLKGLLLGFSPYGFVGIGGYGVRPGLLGDASTAAWSYGAGVHHQLIGPVGVGAEARYREPLDDNSAFSGILPDAWEYRVGLSVSFGERRPARRGGDRPWPPAGWPPVPRRPVPRTPDVGGPEPASARLVARVLDAADGYVGTPYRYGGTSPDDGFDAAGFVQYVFERGGVRLPRTARRIAELGERVPTRIDALRPGDLLFFANDGTTIDHVAIYAGHERIIHSSASGGGVRYDDLGEGERGQWFADHLVAARRLGGDRMPPRLDEELDPPDRAPRASRPQR